MDLLSLSKQYHVYRIIHVYDFVRILELKTFIYFFFRGLFDEEEVRKLKKCFEDTNEVVNNKIIVSIKFDLSIG